MDNSAIAQALMPKPGGMTLADLVAANQQGNPLIGLLAPIPGAAPQPLFPPASSQATAAASSAPASKYVTYKPGNVTVSDGATKPPNSALETHEYNHDTRGGPFSYKVGLRPDGDKIHAIVHSITKDTKNGALHLNEAVNKFRAENIRREIQQSVARELASHAEDKTREARWDSLSEAEKTREVRAEKQERHTEQKAKGQEINTAIEKALAAGWNPRPAGANQYDWHTAPDEIKAFASPQSIGRINAILQQRGLKAGNLRNQIIDAIQSKGAA